MRSLRSLVWKRISRECEFHNFEKITRQIMCPFDHQFMTCACIHGFLYRSHCCKVRAEDARQLGNMTAVQEHYTSLERLNVEMAME